MEERTAELVAANLELKAEIGQRRQAEKAGEELREVFLPGLFKKAEVAVGGGMDINEAGREVAPLAVNRGVRFLVREVSHRGNRFSRDEYVAAAHRLSRSVDYFRVFHENHRFKYPIFIGEPQQCARSARFS